MFTAAKSSLKANKPMEFTGSYTKSEEFFARMRDFTLNSPNPLPWTGQRLPSSLLTSKALPPLPGKGSISFPLIIEQTLSTNQGTPSMRPYGERGLFDYKWK